MREIKFRAWDEERKSMVDWLCMVQTAFNRTGGQSYGIMYMILSGNHHNFKVMQYTGLKDKNGKDIYEGDIINGYPDQNDVVVYSENKFILEPMGDDCIYWDKCEVIGNIYENPEILEPK